MPGLGDSTSHDTNPLAATAHNSDGLMSDGASDSTSDGLASEQVKKFVFTSCKTAQDGTRSNESLEILIPELLEANYSFYTWPCSPVLAWFLWEHKEDLVGKHLLELGAGTSLPGILATKCGANVTLSDCANNTRTLQHMRRCCELNGVLNQVRVIGITWGLFLNSLFTLGPLDLIIGSDCFYEPTVFEDIVVIVAFLLEKNPQAKFLCTYQERSTDWSIEHFLNKWGLTCTHVPLDNLGASSGIDSMRVMANYAKFMLKINNIPWSISRHELALYFSQFGYVYDANVVFDKSGFSKGYGHVTYLKKEYVDSVFQRKHFLEGRNLTMFLKVNSENNLNNDNNTID